MAEADEYDVDEPTDDEVNEEGKGTQQQQQQQLSPMQKPQHLSPSHPLTAHSRQGSGLGSLDASAAYAAAAGSTSAAASAAIEPPDFFAGVAAPAEDSTVGPLSPSAAFAHAASGGVLPTLLSAPNTMRGAGGGSSGGGNSRAVGSLSAAAQGTPTMSSVQGKLRQFIVSEEVAPNAADGNNGPLSSTAAAAATASSSVLDLLSDDLNWML